MKIETVPGDGGSEGGEGGEGGWRMESLEYEMNFA